MLDLEKKRVILDASFVRTCPSDGWYFNWLTARGATLVLTDTLFYELYTTENAEHLLLSVFGKLRQFKDKIEVWTHTSEMMKWEVDNQSPYGCPISESLTNNQFKKLLQKDHINLTDALQKTIETTKKEREASVPYMLSLCQSYKKLLPELSEKIKSKQYQEISDICSLFICSEKNIRCFMKMSEDYTNIIDKVDDTWLVWHDSKALLCIICEGLRYGQLTDFDNLGGEKARHNWINNKNDIDYLVALSRADTIATNDQKILSWFCKWMYGESKKIILPSCIPPQS
jgi:hypothetical protein